MINIICEVSKYLVLLFMVLYTVKCFFGAIIEKRRAEA